jgi:hypothetical protein
LLEESKYILQAIYEVSAQARAPFDVLASLAVRWPTVGRDDLSSHVNSLAGQGLVALRGDGTGTITELGVRALSQLWQSGAFGPPPPQDHATEPVPITGEHLVVIKRQSETPAPRDPALGIARVQRMRSEMEALTAELSAAANLPMAEWTRALEIAAEIDQRMEALEQLLQAMSQM